MYSSLRPAALPAGWSITGGFLIGPEADLQGANLGTST
jgi:hypothetical protein